MSWTVANSCVAFVTDSVDIFTIKKLPPFFSSNSSFMPLYLPVLFFMKEEKTV